MQKIKPLESIQDLNVTLQKAIQSIPVSDRYFIALSGGLDSIALLYFCLPYLKLHTTHIQAIHINHGLSPNAGAWSEFCQDICQSFGVTCHVENVNVDLRGKGLEAEARKARYEVFSRYLISGGVLLQGHHLNDQAETVLMRVFKGLGPEAIKGIPQGRALASGCLYRPWLDVSRELLEFSAKLFALTWVEDESNLDTRFDRNYVRHDVLPMLSQRRPSIINDLARTARKSRESVEFIEEWCEVNQHKFLSSHYSLYQAIDLLQFSGFSRAQQKFIIRFWLDKLGIGHPSDSSFQRVFDELLVAKNDSKAEVCWNDHVLRVFDNALFYLPRLLANDLEFAHETSFEVLVDELGDDQFCLELPVGKLRIALVKADELVSCLQNQNKDVYEVLCNIPESINVLTIKYRAGGEKIYLHQEHSASLKKLYQSGKVLPWFRDKLPLVYSGDELLCSLAGFMAYSCQLEQKNRDEIAGRLIHFRFEIR